MVKSSVDEVTNGRSYLFQQISVSAHKAQITYNWFADNVTNHRSPELWLPSSPNLNPLDLEVCGVVERDNKWLPFITIK